MTSSVSWPIWKKISGIDYKTKLRIDYETKLWSRSCAQHNFSCTKFLYSFKSPCYATMWLYISNLALHKQAQWRVWFNRIAICLYHPGIEMKLYAMPSFSANSQVNIGNSKQWKPKVEETEVQLSKLLNIENSVHCPTEFSFPVNKFSD